MAIKLNIFYLTFLFGLCLSKEPFELKDFLENKFVSKEWNGTWVSDNEILFNEKDGAYYKFNATNNKTAKYIDSKILEKFKNASITVSPDNNYILIKYESKSVFRHSTQAQYAVYSKLLNGIIPIPKKDEFLQLCFWSPTGNSLAYVKDNNIFYIKEVNLPLKITNITDKKSSSVYKGVTDWVYEEEVFANNKATWFSPDGKYLAYAVFDDTNVPKFTYPIYKDEQYPEQMSLHYPKVGANNPKVSVFVHDLNKSKRIEILNLGINETPIEILQSLYWLNNAEIEILTKNRQQNEYRLNRCFISGIWDITCIEADSGDEKMGWVENKLNPKCGHFNSLTEEIGDTRVAQYLGCKNGDMYFTGSIQEKPYEQQIYVSKGHDQAVCLSCNWTTPDGLCKFSEASFSPNCTYAAFICKGPGPTYIEIKDFANKSSYIWEDNSEIRKKLENKFLPEIRDLKINVTNHMQADVRLLLPKIVGNKTYPLIIHVYAGPNSNQIKESFSIGYQHYLVTKKNYIYGYIDGRGSGRRGFNMMFEVYKKLGTVEIDDQIIVTRQLKRTYNFIDPKRVCIWGWSYGGFATGMALTHPNNDVFKCGISVAPVTNFKYYDSIYTERYMGLLKTNEKGYNDTNLMSRVDKLKGKSYFLIHGNADDNVHYQQAMILARAIELADVPFQLLSYPDENHSLKGVSPHLYHAMDRFWEENFKTDDGKGGQSILKSSGCILLLLIFISNFV